MIGDVEILLYFIEGLKNVFIEQLSLACGGGGRWAGGGAVGKVEREREALDLPATKRVQPADRTLFNILYKVKCKMYSYTLYTFIMYYV